MFTVLLAVGQPYDARDLQKYMGLVGFLVAPTH